MEITSKTLIVPESYKRNDDGKQVAPEEAPAQDVMSTPIDINYGNQSIGEGSPLSNGLVTINQTVNDAVNNYRTQCRFCRHFDVVAWHNRIQEIKATGLEGWKSLIQLQKDILGVTFGNPDVEALHRDPTTLEPNLDDALMTLGICHPITEQVKATNKAPTYFICHPLTPCCSKQYCGKQCFQDVEAQFERHTDEVRTEMLKTAEGEKTRKATWWKKYK